MGVPVLIIDDDPAVTEVVEGMLLAAGYSVVVAHNSFLGLRLVREIKPSAVLCDMMMPDMTGADVLHVLATDPTTAQIPRVMITGHVDADRSNADGFLLKPFQASELLGLLQRIERRPKWMRSAVDEREAFGAARRLTSSRN